MKPSPLTLFSIALGLVLGGLTTKIARDTMELAPLVLLMSAIVSPIIVGLVAQGWWALVGVVPTLVAHIGLIVLSYQQAHANKGMELAAFLHSTRFKGTLPWSIGFLLLSIVVSAIMHGVRKSRSGEPHNDTGDN